MKRVKRRANRVRLMLDSGAFTAWTKGEEINLKEYIQYIKDNQSIIDTYFNLDVIPGRKGEKRTPAMVEKSARLSYDNLQKMRKAGLDPIPVFHQGERFYWLEKMLDDGIDYISLGGLGGQTARESKIWLDKCFTRLTDKEGRAIIKVHGLGVASFNLLKRYPWYTCDATSWARTSAYGFIYVPAYKNGEPDYSANPIKVGVSKVERATGIPKDHITRFGPLLHDRVKDFLENHVGITMEEASENYVERARAVVYLMLRFQKAIGEVRFKHRGSAFFESAS